jgi:peptidoglycan/LPS O-acetylase OafA/YrhL
LESEYQLLQTIPQLDRLRGLAILMVVLSHTVHVVPAIVARVFYQGWIGVDLFFVLSGFLITGILWDTRGSNGYFRRFYGRRILRIWPAYLLFLFVVFCIFPLLKWSAGGPALSIPSDPLGAWVYLLMIQNLFGVQLFSSALLVATWSLAVEEQFYLVWPAVIRLASQRVVLPCLMVGLLVLPLIRLWARNHGFSPASIYVNPLTHGDGLLCGAIVALWLRSAKPKRKTLLLAGSILLITGLAAFVPIHPSHVVREYCSPLVFTSVALASTGLLLVALVSENLGSILHRAFFMNGTLSFFGYISYSLYLYHDPILRIVISNKVAARLDWPHTAHFTQFLLAICGIGFSILLAWISRKTLEQWALSKKGLFG